MRFDIITLFPEMFAALEHGILGRALSKGLIRVKCWNPRDFSEDKHRHVDDRPYGGGPGMVMLAQPLMAAISAAQKDCHLPAKVVYLSPQGKPLQQPDFVAQGQGQRVILICGRYEGIDERVIELAVDEEWSLGDFVLSGGEFAAMAIVDGIARLLPDVLGHEDSAAQDSFSEGLLDYPHYTRPEVYRDKAVPRVLLSGDHQAIQQWRQQQALKRTQQRRPELLKSEESH